MLKNLSNKIISILLGLIIITLPLQTRYFFYEENINGSFFEYAAIPLYAVDFLLLFFIIFGIIYSIKNRTLKINKSNILFFVSILLFDLICFLSVINAPEKIFAIYFSARIFLLSIIAFIISVNKIDRNIIANSFIFIASVEGFVSIYQFINQFINSNKFLGVASQLPQDLGVSVVENYFGRFLRSYGTFPHPNILGLFLVVGLFFIIYKIIELNKNNKKENIFERSIYYYLFGINFIGVLFTFSRLAIVLAITLTLGFFIFNFIKKITSHDNKDIYKRNAYSLFILILIMSSSIIPSSYFLIQRLDPSNRLNVISGNERVNQIKDSINMIKDNMFTGVGLRNYTLYEHNKDKSTQIYNLKPVHNIYILIFTELGIFGGVMFLLLLIQTFIKSKNYEFFIPLGLILVFGLTDHFVFTELFGLIIFFIFLGMNNSVVES